MLDVNSSIQQQFSLEMTVVSAQGLKSTSSSLFSHRLRPFITITAFPPLPQCDPFDYKSHRHGVFQTRIDDQGGVNPTWGDKFRVPIDDHFFANQYSCIFLQLYTKRLISGHAQVGWCQIPAADIGLPPVGSVRQLSYRLRGVDGTRTQGVVNVTIKLEGPFRSNNTCETVIGIPVDVIARGVKIPGGASCRKAQNNLTGGEDAGPEMVLANPNGLEGQGCIRTTIR